MRAMVRDEKILILGGFLGSGKTTVLLQLANWITSRSSRETPIAILENEIGEVDVDGSTVGSGGYAVKSLFSGCACCSLLGQLPDAVEGIFKEFDPEVLVLEATGVAVPSSMAQALAPHAKEVRTCVLVDASRWQRIRVPLEILLRGQLESADVILVNKCDLVDESDLESIKNEALEYAGSEKPVVFISAREGTSDTDMATILGEEA